LTRQRDIVCISTNYWHGEWFRKQQFMSRFAADGHRVLFVEPSHSMVRSAGDRPYVRNRLLRSGLEQVADRLWLLTPPKLIPGVSRTAVSKLNARRIGGAIDGACRELGFSEPVVWLYSPELLPALDRFDVACLVLDLVDDLVAYEVKEWRREYVRTCIEETLSIADAVVLTTGMLADGYDVPSDSTCVVPNGFDNTLFTPSADVDSRVAGRSRVAGFVGTLFRHIDTDLLARVADEVPRVELVLVGRVSGIAQEMEALTSRSNVTYLGAVARHEVPGIVAGFDVALVPFRTDDVSRTVSPLKAYEYLAMQKPVVSVAMPALQADPLSAAVRFADSAEAFVSEVSRCLDLDGSPVQTDVSAASWQSRYEQAKRCVGVLLSIGE
jgi:hypothetical protein